MGSIVFLIAFSWGIAGNANCVRIISPFENRPIDERVEHEFSIDSILKGRLDPRDLRFEYAASPMASDGISIFVYSRTRFRGVIGNIEIAALKGSGVPRVQYIEINQHYQGTGLAKALYLIGAKLAFEKYRVTVAADGRLYNHKTEQIWSAFVRSRVATWGDGFGEFKLGFLESVRLEELLRYFYANATERTLEYLVLPGASRFH